MSRIRSRSTSRVRDVRGSGGGASGGGLPGGLGGMLGGGAMKAGGGGIVALIIAVVAVVLTQGGGGGGGGGAENVLSEVLGGGNAPNAASQGGGGTVACETELEQVVCGAVDDVSLYWEEQYPQTFQGQFQGADTVFFSGAVQTGCGRAPASVGPFYCPPDRLVYFDLDFLARLQSEFGAKGDLAAQYIVAHEYGHHVQTITGISQRMERATQVGDGTANENSVKLELQADCFAGAWAYSVGERGLFDSPDEIDEALNAAEAVGDDRIMENAGMDVNPESFTHGSSEQRRQWFLVGYESGDPAQCTTFDGQIAP